MSTTHSFNQAFRIETWTLYSVGIALVAIRLASQVRRLGIRKLRPDDWVVITAIPWYTLLVVSINITIFGGGSNYLTDDEITELTPESKQARIVGSKWILLSEEVMVLSVWTCKACMLLLYKRLLGGLMQERIINAVSIYVALGFVACQIALFASCRPFSGFWEVPAPSHECWSYFSFEVVEGTFNVSADVAVLLVALPLFMKLSIPIQQKAILLGVFGMGSFVIVAAMLTKVYSLVPSLTSYSYLNWYFREASVSLYVTNLPALWALARDIFPSVKFWGYSNSYDGSKYARRSHYNRSSLNPPESAADLEMNGRAGDDFWNDGTRSQSQERIITAHGAGPEEPVGSSTVESLENSPNSKR